MAVPQCENGYTKIANELLEALIARRIPGVIRQVFDCIIRNTYGYSCKERAISLKTIQLATGLEAKHVCRARNVLIESKMINMKPTSKDNIYSINKNYNEWLAPRNIPIVGNIPKVENLTEIPKMGTNVPNGGNKVPIDGNDYNIKETLNKKEIYPSDKNNSQKRESKKNKEPKSELSDSVRYQHFETIWSRYPKRMGKKEAYRHYKASVLKEIDMKRIEHALENYLDSEYGGANKEIKYVQQGKVWFNNWEDWEHGEPISRKNGVAKYIRG